MSDLKPRKIMEEVHEIIILGLQETLKRSRDFSQFIETYRNQTKLPKPISKKIKVCDFSDNLFILMQDELKKESI
jgi:hypothetical protein